MARLPRPLNEAKTHIRQLPQERFEFLGYDFGRYYSPIAQPTNTRLIFVRSRVDPSSTAAIASVMRLHDEFGLSVSDDTIYRALNRLGFSHLSARPKAYKQDPEAIEAFKKRMARPVCKGFVRGDLIQWGFIAHACSRENRPHDRSSGVAL